MAQTPTVLVTPQLVANSTTTYYTGSNIKTRIDKATITNVNAAARTVTIYVVPSGGSAGDSTMIVKARSIAPSETWNVTDLIGHIMPADAILQLAASNASSLTLYVTGTTIS